MYLNLLTFKKMLGSLLLTTHLSCQIPMKQDMYDSQSAIPTATMAKHAYLTFDDGPSVNTERILHILRQYGIHATFFVIGDSSEEGKRLYRRIYSEGHTIGNHTYTHNYQSVYKSVQAFSNDTERLERLLEQTIGVRPTLLRYPGGSNNQVSRRFGGRPIMHQIINEMRSEGYDYLDWNVSSTDAARTVQPKNEIIDAVLSACKNKQEAIILMHDMNGKTTTVEALPTIIEGLRKQGFQFNALSKDSFHFHFEQY